MSKKRVEIAKYGRRRGAVVAVLCVLLPVTIVGSITLGRYPIRLSDITQLLFQGGADATKTALFFNVRLPRVLLSCMVGCSLSAAGAAYQGVFKNPMAAPDILGASSGAATGAALALLLGLSQQSVTLFAFLFSLGAIATVMLISRAARGERLLGIILAGIMVSSLANAATSFIKLVADPASVLPEITYWLMGSLAKTKPGAALFAAVPMTLGAATLFILRWHINLLTMPDDDARTMGVNVGAVRFAVIAASTLITAASVSVSGLIGWVGLVVPHLLRRLVGSDYRYLMPASMLGGALFLLAADDISRNLLITEIPIGILTAVVGAPFFIWLITRKREAS